MVNWQQQVRVAEYSSWTFVKLQQLFTYHIDNTNELKVKHNFDDVRRVQNWVTVLLVVLEQLLVKTRLVVLYESL